MPTEEQIVSDGVKPDLCSPEMCARLANVAVAIAIRPEEYGDRRSDDAATRIALWNIAGRLASIDETLRRMSERDEARWEMGE